MCDCCEKTREEISQRFAIMADEMQKIKDPMIKLTNGEERELPFTEAIQEIWSQNYYMQGELIVLKERTEILDDMKKLKVLWKKYNVIVRKTLKTIFHILVWIILINLMFYLASKGYLTTAFDIFKSILWKII